jgi:biopolymer transport protein ExbD
MNRTFLVASSFLLFVHSAIAQDTLNLVVTSSEYVLGNTHLASTEALAGELARVQPKELRIKPAKGVEYERVAEVLRVIQKQGNIFVGIVGNEKPN